LRNKLVINASFYEKSNLQGFLVIFFHIGLLFLFLIFFHWIDSLFFKILIISCTGIVMSFLGWSGLSHELLHGNLFKNRSYNEFFLIIFSIISWNNWEYHRISHRIHHAQTLKNGVDFEFSLQQKFPSRFIIVINWIFFDFIHLKRVLRNNILNSINVIPGPLEKYFFLNMNARKKVVNSSRLILFFHSLIFISSFYFEEPIILILSFGSMFFTYFSRLFTIIQHLECICDNEDPRNVSNTILLPLIFRLLYCNMNYHIEHHISAAIPTYKLAEFSNFLNNNNFKIPYLKFSKIIFIPFSNKISLSLIKHS
jgi:fatty acid desaturase